MTFLKNLLFLVAMFATVPAFAEDITIKWDGNKATAYSSTSLWEHDFPSDFPRECLEEVLKAGHAVCAPVEHITRSYFSNLAVWDECETKHYAVKLTGGKMQVSAQDGEPFTRKRLVFTVSLLYIMGLCFAVLAIVNALTETKRRKLLFAYAAVALGVIVDGAVSVIGNPSAGMLAGILTGTFTSAWAGLFAGESAGLSASLLAGGLFYFYLFAGLMAGALAGGFASLSADLFVRHSGWVGGGINEYLVFLALLSVAGFALRELITFIRVVCGN